MKMRFTLTSLGVLTAAALAITTLTAGARPEMQSLEADSLVPELAIAQSATDILPDFMQPLMDDIPLQEGSVRLMAQSSYGTHWIAVDGNKNICIIALLQDESAAGSNCMPRPAFYASGASLAVSGPSGPAVVAHLLPAGVGQSAVEEAIVAENTGATMARNVPRDNAVKGSLGVETFAHASLIVLDADAAAALGSVHIPRAGQQELILHDMAS